MKYLCLLLTCLLYVRISDELAVTCDKKSPIDCKVKLCREIAEIIPAKGITCETSDVEHEPKQDDEDDEMPNTYLMKWLKTAYGNTRIGCNDEKKCVFGDKDLLCPYTMTTVAVRNVVKTILEARKLKTIEDNHIEHSKFIYAVECDKFARNNESGKKEQIPFDKITPLKTCTTPPGVSQCPRGSQCVEVGVKKEKDSVVLTDKHSVCLPKVIENCGANVQSLKKKPREDAKIYNYDSADGKCTLS